MTQRAVAEEPRRSPLWIQVALLVAFLVLAVVSAFTVFIPEVLDDSNEDAPQQAPTP